MFKVRKVLWGVNLRSHAHVNCCRKGLQESRVNLPYAFYWYEYDIVTFEVCEQGLFSLLITKKYIFWTL